MSAKKHGLGAALIFTAAAAAVAGGVVGYLKRREIKKFTDDVMAKLKATDEDGVYTADLDGDGTPDVILADTTGDGKIDSVMMDTTGDGNVDAVALDLDADGEPDIIITDLQPEEHDGEDTAQTADEEPETAESCD